MSTHYVGQIAPNYIHSTMQSNSEDDSFTFTVGKLDAGMAILIGEKASLIEFPSLLLPPGVSSGSVVNIRVLRNDQQERRQKDEFDQLQEDILHTFGQQSPKAPALRLRNVTQTSVTLEWDRLTLATATLLSLDIYRNGQRLAPIPNPLHNTSTKLSGLDVNAEYTFHLVMKTTAGTFSSPIIKTRTHTINDTSGISVCFGHVQDPEMLEAAKKALNNMHAKFNDRIQIDTTHYICTDPRNPGGANAAPGSEGSGYTKAMQLSIPAVLPHWIFACHDQKKMVGISPFYLDQDPPNASTIRQTIDRVLGKEAASAPAAAAATTAATAGPSSEVDGASRTTTPPPPLEKDTKPSSPEEAAAEEKEEEPKTGAVPSDADQAPVNGAQLPETQTETQASDSAAEAQPSHSQPTPIITTSAPSEDGDAHAEQEPEHDPTHTAAPAPPQVVITPTDSQEQVAATHTSSHPQDYDYDEDAEGEMDEVSLGGDPSAENSLQDKEPAT